jgi:hypothetical protein
MGGGRVGERIGGAVGSRGAAHLNPHMRHMEMRGCWFNIETLISLFDTFCHFCEAQNTIRNAVAEKTPGKRADSTEHVARGV